MTLYNDAGTMLSTDMVPFSYRNDTNMLKIRYKVSELGDAPQYYLCWHDDSNPMNPNPPESGVCWAKLDHRTSCSNGTLVVDNVNCSSGATLQYGYTNCFATWSLPELLTYTLARATGPGEACQNFYGQTGQMWTAHGHGTEGSKIVFSFCMGGEDGTTPLQVIENNHHAYGKPLLVSRYELDSTYWNPEVQPATKFDIPQVCMDMSTNTHCKAPPAAHGAPATRRDVS